MSEQTTPLNVSMVIFAAPQSFHSGLRLRNSVDIPGFFLYKQYIATLVFNKNLNERSK